MSDKMIEKTKVVRFEWREWVELSISVDWIYFNGNFNELLDYLSWGMLAFTDKVNDMLWDKKDINVDDFFDMVKANCSNLLK